MKIAFLGDVNNVLLTVAIGLHQRGHDVVYLPSLKLNQHFRIYDMLPADFNLSHIISFDDYTINSSSIQASKLISKITELHNEGFIFVGSNLSPFIFALSNIPLNIFVATGADVYAYTNDSFKGIITRILSFLADPHSPPFNISKLQTAGILKANVIVSHSDGYFKLAKPSIRSIKPHIAPYPIPLHNSYGSLYKESSVEHILIDNLISRIRRDSSFIAIMLSKIDPIKGSSIFIKGFYDFVKLYNPTARLLIPYRGRFDHVFKSLPELRELIQLGNIHLIPPVTQSSVFYLHSLCDVAFGIHYGTHTKHDWNTTLMQALQVDVPLITFSPFKNFCNIPHFPNYPHLNSFNYHDVCQNLLTVSSPSFKEEFSDKSSQWRGQCLSLSLEIWESLLTQSIS